MKDVVLLPLVAALCMSGCSSGRFVSLALSDPKLDLALDLPRVTASGEWRPSEPGHGLQIHVWASAEAGDYEPNLELELEGAAKVCATLARDDRVLEWAYIDLYFYITFQGGAGATRDVVGVAEVIVRRETLLMLRQNGAPLSEYPRHWRFVSGYKDQPASKTVLSW